MKEKRGTTVQRGQDASLRILLLSPGKDKNYDQLIIGANCDVFFTHRASISFFCCCCFLAVDEFIYLRNGAMAAGTGPLVFQS